VDVAMRLVPDINSSEPIMVERLEQYHRWVWWFKRRYEGKALRNEERLFSKRDYYECFTDVRNLVSVGVLTALNVEELSKRRTCFKRAYRWFAQFRWSTYQILRIQEGYSTNVEDLIEKKKLFEKRL
jgi:hypothetical protein